MKKWIGLFLAALCLMPWSGCRTSPQAREDAVESARKYIYKQATELTPEEIGFIRNTKPALLQAPVIGKRSMVSKAKVSDAQRQICITWLLPERREAYMVYGFSSEDMHVWRPVRLIRKRFIPPDSVFNNSVSAARSYAANAEHFQLSVPDSNWMRFSNPEVVESSFPLSLNPDDKRTPEEIAALTKGKKQYSLIWPSISEPGMFWVFSGLGSAETFTGWSVNIGSKFSAEEVKAQTTGERYYDPTLYHAVAEE